LAKATLISWTEKVIHHRAAEYSNVYISTSSPATRQSVTLLLGPVWAYHTGMGMHLSVAVKRQKRHSYQRIALSSEDKQSIQPHIDKKRGLSIVVCP
jgi:hypothetical protein